MAEPTPYTPGYDFTALDEGTRLNVEFQNIETAIDETQTALAQVRRSDGQLQNGIVGPDALLPTLYEGLDAVVGAQLTAAAATATAGAATATTKAAAALADADRADDAAARAEAAENSLLEWTGSWLTATDYAPSDLAREGGTTYVCVTAHTSGTFSTDFSGGLWEVFAQQGSTGPGGGDMLSTNNLSDVANAATARTNLGLGDLAVDSLADYSRADSVWTTGTNTALAMLSPAQLKLVVDVVAGRLLGVGQQWRNMASLRAIDTAYQNTTGRTISVSVAARNGSSGGEMFLEASTNGSTWVPVAQSSVQGPMGQFCAEIPTGHFYRFRRDGGSITIEAWAELRT